MSTGNLAARLLRLLTLLLPLQAGAAPMVFRHVTVDEGLAQNTVLATLQDSQGFLWIATQNGLDRYDGYGLRHFTHQRGVADGLPTNYVWAMTADRSGALWLAIKDGGVARFDTRTETFTNYRHDPANAATLSTDAARQLLVDRDQQIWVATFGGGLNRLDPAMQTLIAHLDLLDPRGNIIEKRELDDSKNFKAALAHALLDLKTNYAHWWKELRQDR